MIFRPQLGELSVAPFPRRMEEQEERPGLSLPIGVPQTKHLRGWVAGKGSVCECQSVKRAEDKNITKREREIER
jgi:hypothetical protein